MNIKLTAFSLITAFVSFLSCTNSQNNNKQTMNTKDSTVSASGSIKEDSVNFSVNGKNYICTVAYDENTKGKRPGILVIPEWWGLNNYTKNRAKQLAGLGYIAMAVDMYGDGKIAPDPKIAQEMATPFYKDPSMAKTQIDAAIIKLKSFPQTDTSKIAAIGYCFGGFIVLNAAKLGADLDGVVTFHGGLGGVAPDKKLLKAKILVCHGGADVFVNPDVAEFKKQMDSVGANYTFKIYPDATHAFSNPDATETGKKFNMPIRYNAAADTASWNDMKTFFKKLF
ncbi:MAG: dienelactone hydrolase family protein [Bacteroidota bacterium]|nr:dienelactone hydrolase family protein [Bacteroidota bacterium]